MWKVFWLFLPALLVADTEFHVNHCVLRCKDNHMREMDNEWSHDFTLPLLNLLRTTGNETAAFIKAQAICTSNRLLEVCIRNCNSSQEASIILAGIRSWHDACNNLDEVRAQFPCWKENGDRLSSVCRDQTIRLERDMLKFAKNQTQENIETICIDFEHFSHCFIQEHGKYCGYRSEVITARMFENNREAMFKMLKIRWNTLPASCKYTQLRRDTYSSDRVSARYPIETWSRPQLEDHFHNVVEELQSAQKKIKEQEKQITTFNTRFRRNLLERKSRDEKVVERSKYDDVVKENQILDMKLKAAKHQLLIYTAPSARAATASLMTGRSTFRQPPSTWRQRPPVTGSIDRPPSAPIIRKKSTEAPDKLQLATDEKLTIVKLNRTLKAKNDEISELKYTIEKMRNMKGTTEIPRGPTASSGTSESSSNNNNDEEESDESEMSEMSELSGRSGSGGSVTPIIEEKKPSKRGSNGAKHVPPQQPPRIQDQSEKALLDKLRIAENDLQMLREELEVVKKANERLVHQSLSKSTEYGARDSIEEKKKIVTLEEQLKETEKRIKESESRRREDQKKFEAMRVHYKEKYEKAKAAKADVKTTTSTVTNVKVEENRSDSPPAMTYEPLRKRPSQSEIHRMRKADDDLLQKLYKEVADILHSHDVGISEMRTLGSGENTLAKWQKLYAELYEELEKIRNMLVVQYDINQKQNNEIIILKDELERLKTLSAEMVEKWKVEMEEKQKKIFLLEEQIRTIAYTGQHPVKLLSNPPVPQSNLNTNLSVKLLYVKPSPALTSKFFFSLEFFDFHTETTPIMDPKEQNMDFTTFYDVLVSNLLIYYLQTNGISIEMYRPADDGYKLIGAGTISLIPLFEENVLTKYCSEIVLKSVETGGDICTLRYDIQVSRPVSESFKRFKSSEVARNMMPLQLETNEVDDFEPLIVMINRVVGLESLGREQSAEFCIAYELLSFSPYFTDFSTSSEIKSNRTIMIPKTDAARKNLSEWTISLFLMENIPKTDGVCATLHLPLHSLCKLGGAIKGTFPMLDLDSHPSSIAIDLCIMWKHEIPSFFIKKEHQPEEEQRKKPLPSTPSVPPKSQVDTPILPAVRRPSKQFDVVPVASDEPILRQELPISPAAIPADLVANSMPRLVSTSSSSSETSFSSSSRDVMSPPKKPEPMAFNYSFQPVAPEPDVHTSIKFEDQEEEIESVSANASYREAPGEPAPEPEQEPIQIPPRLPPLQRQATEPEKAESPVADEENDDTPRPSEHSEEVEETPPTQRSVEEVPVMEEGQKEDPVAEKERNREEEHEIQRKLEEERKAEELKSMLGVLPPIAKPRNIPVNQYSLSGEEPPKPPRGHGLVFSENLTHSIPPSESSSTSTPRRADKPPVPLPPYEGRSLIKREKSISPRDKDVLEPDCKVVFQLESIEFFPETRMSRWSRDDPKLLIDWIFLDFSHEQSQSTIFELPKRPQDLVGLNSTKEYVLTRGQISLLGQWIRNSIKIELTLIKKSPGEEEELGYGVLTLVPNNSQMKSMVLDLIDVNTTVLAELQLSIQFSKTLLEQLNF